MDPNKDEWRRREPTARRKSLRRVGLPVLVGLAATGVVGVVINRIERTRNDELAAADARAGALRANDALKALLERTEARVENALESPRLRAALDASVDTETLRDLLLTEPWWGSFRASVKGFGMIRAGTSVEVSSNLSPSLDLRSLVKQARAGAHPVSRFAAVDGQVLALTASSIVLRGQNIAPVLLATQVISTDFMAAVVDRAGGATGISDGSRTMVNRAAPGSGPGDLAVLDAATDIPLSGASALNHSGLAIASLPLAGDGGFRLLVLTRRSTGSGLADRLPWSILVALLAGPCAALLVIVLLRRPATVRATLEKTRPALYYPQSAGRHTLTPHPSHVGADHDQSTRDTLTDLAPFIDSGAAERTRPALYYPESAERRTLALHPPRVGAAHDQIARDTVVDLVTLIENGVEQTAQLRDGGGKQRRS